MTRQAGKHSHAQSENDSTDTETCHPMFKQELITLWMKERGGIEMGPNVCVYVFVCELMDRLSFEWRQTILTPSVWIKTLLTHHISGNEWLTLTERAKMRQRQRPIERQSRERVCVCVCIGVFVCVCVYRCLCLCLCLSACVRMSVSMQGYAMCFLLITSGPQEQHLYVCLQESKRRFMCLLEGNHKSPSSLHHALPLVPLMLTTIPRQICFQTSYWCMLSKSQTNSYAYSAKPCGHTYQYGHCTHENHRTDVEYKTFERFRQPVFSTFSYILISNWKDSLGIHPPSEKRPSHT